MARIDTGRIEGYQSMTPEQKLAALEAFEFEDNAAELERYKNAASKANGQAADWKKKYRELLAQDDPAKGEPAAKPGSDESENEEVRMLKERLEQMEKEMLISNHKSRFLGLGYDEVLAEETARAMANGEADKVFANQQKFLESHDKAYKAKLMGQITPPPAGSSAVTGAADYSKLISEAQAGGDYAQAAYYTRLSEQQKKNE